MQNKYLTPIAIVVAGLIIAGAVYYGPGKAPTPSNINANRQDTLTKLAKIDSTDHVRGSLEAPVKIIEFSDLECPFCKVSHIAMKKLAAKYGDKVLWVFRNFPLDSLHSKARTEAQAAECIAKLAGNEKYWEYVDKIFEVTPSNNGLDLTLLPKMATDMGLDQTKFNDCVSKEETKAAVDADSQDGVNIGVDGTPYIVMIDKAGNKSLVFREQPRTDWDAETKAIMSDLTKFQQETLAAFRSGSQQ